MVQAYQPNGVSTSGNVEGKGEEGTLLSQSANAEQVEVIRTEKAAAVGAVALPGVVGNMDLNQKPVGVELETTSLKKLQVLPPMITGTDRQMEVKKGRAAEVGKGSPTALVFPAFRACVDGLERKGAMVAMVENSVGIGQEQLVEEAIQVAAEKEIERLVDLVCVKAVEVRADAGLEADEGVAAAISQ